MPRFEKRITDEQVARARERIDAGATLRAAAADIPCAASTLSYRIRRLKEAELAEQTSGDPRPTDTSFRPDASGVAVDQVGPLETLREALRATTPDGDPHWPTRISAARVLAMLRPEELEPKPEQVEPEIIVYDLPPGSNPVIHRAPPSKEDPASGAEANEIEAGVPDEQPSGPVVFSYEPTGDQDSVSIGIWSPPSSGRTVSVTLRLTADPKTADRWRAELTAGRLPEIEDDS